jgi:hypothetical protein
MQEHEEKHMYMFFNDYPQDDLRNGLVQNETSTRYYYWEAENLLLR